MTNRQLKKAAEKPKLGKKILNFLITDTNRKKLRRHLKGKARIKMIRQVSRDGEFHLEDILNACLNHISPITAPLTLISQVPFSGGYLLNRLFDGHSEIHALPHELIPAIPERGLWPAIDLDNRPEDWFEGLFKELDIANIQKGAKHGTKCNALAPFVFLPLVQEQIFLKYLQSIESIKQRDLFDAYMTSCFGAWLNYQNLNGNKMFTTAYGTGMAMQHESIKSFFEIYPDGRLISLVRKPETWFACARAHEPEIYGNTREAIRRWKESVRVGVETKKKFGDRVCLIKFEDLIGHTASVMQYLSELLKIRYEDILLIPTFDGIPIQLPNGQNAENFDTKLQGFSKSRRLDKHQQVLIEKMTAATYQSALQHVVIF
jgi:hypothetical protein